jgi:fibro-slime domain-containing protein
MKRFSIGELILMRRMKRFMIFGSIFVLSFALLMIAMPYVMKLAVKSSAGASDPEMGQISYYRADLFDYVPSKRSVNGNFLLGQAEYMTDAALLLFDQDDIVDMTEGSSVVGLPKVGEHNSREDRYRYKVVQGLVSESLDADGAIALAGSRVAVSGADAVKLFDSTDSRTYRGAYSFPFENVGDGYLHYDSSKNHVQVTKSVGEDGLLIMDRLDGATQLGFMPFDKVNASGRKDEKGYYASSEDNDFFFGARFEIPFMMTKGGTVITGTGQEKDMMFEYAGDGEIWVYIDGRLVLDIGGVHSSVKGSINLATGVVTSEGNHLDETTGRYNADVSTVMVEDTYIKSLSVGRHKLQVFYLERGGLTSDCDIRVRLKEDRTPEESRSNSEQFVGPRLSEDDDDI